MFNLIEIKNRQKIKITKVCELLKEFSLEFYSFLENSSLNTILSFITPKIISNEIKEGNYRYFLIDSDDKIVGILVLKKSENKILNISKLFISKEHRNNGFGWNTIKLIKQIFKEENYQNLRLSIPTENENLFELFKKWGFKKDKEIARYFGDNIYIYENVFIL